MSSLFDEEPTKSDEDCGSCSPKNPLAEQLVAIAVRLDSLESHLREGIAFLKTHCEPSSNQVEAPDDNHNVKEDRFKLDTEEIFGDHPSDDEDQFQNVVGGQLEDKECYMSSCYEIKSQMNNPLGLAERSLKNGNIEVEYSTTGYNEIVGQHADFSDQLATVPSTAHICPFIAYVHPSTSSTNLGDAGRYNNNRWTNSLTQIPNSYSFPTMDVHYNSHVDHYPLPTRTNIDMPTSGSYVHPFLASQSSSTRDPNSISSLMNYPHLGSGARAWERTEPHFQQPSTHIMYRSNTQMHVGSSSDQTHCVYVPSSSRNFNDAHILERHPPHPYPYPHPHPHETGPYHQPGGGSARQRHGSMRILSQNQYWL
ncbi:hypothetical protein E3N88_09118 [Mikania micrantha]|uniref:Uncharacterized protein n=1 Tax=Mikania micrantha TaxID=192012 RepID=A0A5N6PIT3_9ASTR|nr:hypothetical protein E3N88_09118 [Mikania micrantha]